MHWQSISKSLPAGETFLPHQAHAGEAGEDAFSHCSCSGVTGQILPAF
jgi:hypothetical protein